jgi:hypothetical protein
VEWVVSGSSSGSSGGSGGSGSGSSGAILAQEGARVIINVLNNSLSAEGG